MAQIKMSDYEFMLRQVRTDKKDGLSPQEFEYLQKIAKEWGVPVTGIAWIGNKPYPMQAALFRMLENKCEKEGLVIKGIVVTPVARAEANSLRSGQQCQITLFDQRTFSEIMAKTALDKLPVETVKEFRTLLTHQYQEEGWASPESVRMDTLHNPDYLNHMSATRAVDRAIRIIVRCPFTAESELPTGSVGELPGTFTPPETGVADVKVQKPGQKANGESPAQEPSKPAVEKKVPDGTIKKISPKKTEKIASKQVGLAVLQWTNYCKGAAPSIAPQEIDEKRGKLLRALFSKEKVEDLSVAELEEWVGMMTRKEIEIASDAPAQEAPPAEPEKPEIKT